jgi:hypothetical protein
MDGIQFSSNSTNQKTIVVLRRLPARHSLDHVRDPGTVHAADNRYVLGASRADRRPAICLNRMNRRDHHLPTLLHESQGVIDRLRRREPFDAALEWPTRLLVRTQGPRQPPADPILNDVREVGHVREAASLPVFQDKGNGIFKAGRVETKARFFHDEGKSPRRRDLSSIQLEHGELSYLTRQIARTSHLCRPIRRRRPALPVVQENTSRRCLRV